MFAKSLALAAFAACLAAPCALAQPVAMPVPAVPAANNAADPAPLWLDPVEFSPDHAFAPPPVRGSLEEQLDLARLRALIAGSSPARLAQAAWDGAHEEPAVFNEAAGRDLTKLPATMDLLVTVQQEVERVTDIAKHHYLRPRPFMVDPALPHCGKGENVRKAYPSGHAGFGWSVGWTLARLLPARAPAILARAQDYGLSRQICGVHYATDIEASHAVGVLAAETLLRDPRLAAKVAAAKAELGQP